MSTYLITVQPAGWRFEAAPGRALLLAAEDAGIMLPASCRNGSCRTCLCQVAAGELAYLIDWPGISADEKRAGDTLPCVAVARSDLTLWAPAARRVTR
ncbi:2Fe-2S iron-sulfur cluster binding domain-containing protein [Massilia sp. CCM 8695]|uniref:2Fe-2S iron-sulfur cluster binding domain-containing protein n=1 Tax=Massilia frigida TaxID=2609281 RepID=A0ABX0N3I9_9BURK|nr:2Fe-2S iron-sulfur cluster-binding protein [Massilia frigida]NHZ79893.1 2Fe-2S iron-sulfur cluster binding domain-containing protein [Massilia frigida]